MLALLALQVCFAQEQQAVSGTRRSPMSVCRLLCISIAASACLSIFGCGSSGASSGSGRVPVGGAPATLGEGQVDARSAARIALNAESYQSTGSSYGCTQDCSGHDAGFEWAKDNDIDDDADCGGNSESFIEGCQTFVEALQEELEKSEDGEDETEE